MTKTRDLADLGGGFIQAGTGAVQRTTESKLQDVVSVKDFGAVGNGIDDDRAAIQAAIDAVAAAGGGCLFLPKGSYAILTSHPSKTYTTAGDDGSVPSGYGTNLSAETVYQIPVGLWLKENVILDFESEANIVGTWQYATTSPIDINQRIGILISKSTASSNPKSATLRGGIIGSGSVSSFMINVLAEGILTNSQFSFSSGYSAFPFIAQGADRCGFDVNTAACKTGLIIGGQWLTRANSVSAAYLPQYPAGFGNTNIYPATDVYLTGWCDNCTFSSSMIRPEGNAVTADYDAWEASIDTFFDTYFFKSGSSSRLGSATPSPAVLAAYPGVVGFGLMLFSRYGRSIANPAFSNIKTYNCIRGDIYCDNGQCLSIDNVYSERTGTIGGAAFGVVVNDPYGTPGVASGRFIRATGNKHKISNYFAFSSQITTPLQTTNELVTLSCYFNSSNSGFNNYNSETQDSLANARIQDLNSLGGNGYNIAKRVGVKAATSGSSADVATIDVLNTTSGYAINGVLKVQGTVLGSTGVSGYASSVYEFPIVISNNNGTLYSLGGTTALRSTVGTINAAFADITLAFNCTMSGTQATLSITPTITGTLGLTSAVLYWSLEVNGAIMPTINAI